MHPIDDGVISRSELVEDMVSILIKEVSPSKVTMPRVVASIPSEVTEVRKKSCCKRSKLNRCSQGVSY